jgi:3-phenylpropionate/trans-cinnamate dioxygenase ferredoxin reductase subunit
MTRSRFVIVGAGECGVSAAATLREEGFDGHLTVIGDEPDRPYERPPLSKDYLLGGLSSQELAVRPGGWYEDNEVNLILGTPVTAVSPSEHLVSLADGSDVAYDRLLIASGGRPRRLRQVNSPRVAYLRRRADADRLKELLVPGARLVVLGGGFIGCEVAATARLLGVEVVVMEALNAPMERVLGEEIGHVFTEIHRDQGVDVRLGERMDTVAETPNGLLLTTSRGQLECSALLVAIGIEPNVELALRAAIEVANGIVVDEHCATTADDVFAAGDVAAQYHEASGQRMRVEHQDNATNQGAAAARNMLGGPVVFDDPRWFWSDQYEHNIQSVGLAVTWDEILVRGSIQDRSFSAFYLRDGRIQRVLALNRPTDVLDGGDLIGAHVGTAAHELTDESIELRQLACALSAHGGP